MQLVPTALLARIGLPLALAGGLAAQSLVYEFRGTGLQDQLGTAIACAGDIDADGHDDLLVASSRSLVQRYVRILSGRDGRVLREHLAPAGSDWYGHRIDGGVDVDNDGVPDYGISDPYAESRRGRAWVHSGKTGVLLHTYTGTTEAWLGAGFCLLPDIDADGHGDFAIGAPLGGTEAKGIVTVRSGKTGLELRAHEGDTAGYGSELAGGHDTDGDGVADYAVALPGVTGRGSVELRSGRTGTRLHLVQGAAAGDGFGTSVCLLPDLDGDKAAELVVGAPWAGTPAAGEVRVWSGKTAKLLRTLSGAHAGAEFGLALAHAGELDGDSKAELLVGAPGLLAGSSAVGGVFVQRGAYLQTGSGSAVLASLSGASASDRAGRSVTRAGDMNGDGVPDYAFGIAGDDTVALNAGAVRVISGRALALTASRHELSLASGGRVEFSLAAGAANAFDLYLFLGSSTGITPVTRIGQLELRLVLDAYTSFMLNAPNVLIVPALAQLDAKGQAQAAWAIPPGLPAALAGLRLDHLYLVLETDGSEMEFASDPVPLRLVR